MNFLCRVLGHRRSRRDAYRVAEKWVSRCSRCGRTMVRAGPKRWREASPTFVDALRDYEAKDDPFLEVRRSYLHRHRNEGQPTE